MRLLHYNDGGELKLTEDLVDNVPPYAILSHTWGSVTEEVFFRNIMDGTGQSLLGYQKIHFCGQQARRDGIQYFWVDTCCIDFVNRAQLIDAINSIFLWYRNAAKCYVYLSDVSETALVPHEPTTTSVGRWQKFRILRDRRPSWDQSFRKSRWFTRAWTLPELIAPPSVEFFSSQCQRLGDKKSLEGLLREITRIPLAALQGTSLSEFTVSERLSWAEHRKSSLEEDQVYCLLGIFDIHMPLVYGEGKENAIRRLRHEIDRTSNLGYTSATVTTQDPALLTQRPARFDELASHRMDSIDSEEAVLAIQHCRNCNILFGLWIFIAALSLAVGLWRSFQTFDEGKGFTDAAYVVAVGGLIIYPVQNRHNERCKKR